MCAYIFYQLCPLRSLPLLFFTSFINLGLPPQSSTFQKKLSLDLKIPKIFLRNPFQKNQKSKWYDKFTHIMLQHGKPYTHLSLINMLPRISKHNSRVVRTNARKYRIEIIKKSDHFSFTNVFHLTCYPLSCSTILIQHSS